MWSLLRGRKTKQPKPHLQRKHSKNFYTPPRPPKKQEPRKTKNPVTCLRACSSAMHASQLPHNRLVAFFSIIAWKSHAATRWSAMIMSMSMLKALYNSY